MRGFEAAWFSALVAAAAVGCAPAQRRSAPIDEAKTPAAEAPRDGAADTPADGAAAPAAVASDPGASPASKVRAKGSAPKKKPPSSLAAAKKTLKTARSMLEEAVALAKKDPPQPVHLDAALAKVQELKAVLDAGSEFEPKDLAYAKSALAGQKRVSDPP